MIDISVKVRSEQDRKIDAMIEYGLIFALPKIKGGVTKGKLKCRGINLEIEIQCDGSYSYSYKQRGRLLAPTLIIKHIGLADSNYVINFNYDPELLLSDIKNILK